MRCQCDFFSNSSHIIRCIQPPNQNFNQLSKCTNPTQQHSYFCMGPFQKYNVTSKRKFVIFRWTPSKRKLTVHWKVWTSLLTAAPFLQCISFCWQCWTFETVPKENLKWSLTNSGGQPLFSTWSTLWKYWQVPNLIPFQPNSVYIRVNSLRSLCDITCIITRALKALKMSKMFNFICSHWKTDKIWRFYFYSSSID